MATPGITAARRNSKNLDKSSATTFSTQSDDVSEGTLALNNSKWQLRGLYASFGGFLGWALVVALAWALLESSPFADSVSSSTGVKGLHINCAVAWSMFTGLAGMGMFVAGSGSGTGNYLKSLCVTVGVVMSSYYIFEINGILPILLSPSGAPIYVMRVFAWFFTTSLLIFALWASSDCKQRTLWIAFAFDWGMLASRLAGSLLDGNWRYGTFPVMLLCGGGLVVKKTTMFNSLGKACRGFPKALASVRRLQAIHMLSWTAFPVILALDAAGVLSSYEAELCTTINEVLAFGLFAEAMGQGVLKLSGDRKTTRLQSRSLDLVKQLQEADKRKDRFFAAMSHELRTPLNGIIGLTDSLLHSEKANLTPKAVRSLTTVLDTGRRFGKLINTILDSASIKEQRLQLSLSPVSIHQVVEEAVGLINPIMSADIKVSIQVPENIPLLHADYNRLMQIMYNLLGNAAKFCTKGTITVRAMQMAEKMLIEVEDTGIGIEEDKLQHVFEAFEQVDNSQSRSYGGTGLGLNLALGLAKAHKGDLQVRSTFGRGTVFTLSLPMVAESNDTFIEDRKGEARAAEARDASLLEAEQSRDLPPEKRSKSQSQSKGLVNTWLETKNGMSTPYMAMVQSQANKTIELLSVDDDPVNQDVMQDLLGGLGYKVTVAMSGIEALKILEERFETDGVGGFPSVVLMDNMMPGMTGLETTRKIRDVYPMVEMPIIMVTANDDEKTVCKALREGCNDFVNKPVRRSELEARVALQIKLLAYYSKEVESRKQEHILKDILPPSIIQRLSVGQTRIADRLERVTVLFADIVGFTRMSSIHSTQSIVTMLDSLFSGFDSLTDKLSVQKIETIGDCYMVVCGLEGEEDQADRMVKMAKEMLKTASEIISPSGKPISIRVGIHTGPAYAGVVGQKCPRYCLFGDTVNTASRMESTGFPAAVHLSNSTYELFQESDMSTEVFFCDLGEREVKGKGAMQSWLLQDGAWEAALQQHVEVLKSAAEQSSMQPATTAAAAAAGSEAASGQGVMRFSDKLDHIGSRVEVLPEKMDSLSLQVKALRRMISSSQDGFKCQDVQEPKLKTVPRGKSFRSMGMGSRSRSYNMLEDMDLYDQVPPTPGSPGTFAESGMGGSQQMDSMPASVLKDAAQRASEQLSGINEGTPSRKESPVPPESANADKGEAREGTRFNPEATDINSNSRESGNAMWDSAASTNLQLSGDGGPSTDMLYRLQQEACLKSLVENNQLTSSGYANPLMLMLAKQSLPGSPSTPDSGSGPGQPMRHLPGMSMPQTIPSNALGQEDLARQLFMAQQAQQLQQIDAVTNPSLMQMLQHRNSLAAEENFRMLQFGAQSGIAPPPAGEEAQLLRQFSQSAPELPGIRTRRYSTTSMGLQAVPENDHEGGHADSGCNKSPTRPSQSFNGQRSMDCTGSASMEQQQQLYIQQLLVQQQQHQKMMQQQQQLLQQQFMQQQP